MKAYNKLLLSPLCGWDLRSAALHTAAPKQSDRPDALRAPGLSSRSQVNFIGYQARADSHAAYQPAEAEFLPQENAPHFPLVGICLAPRRYVSRRDGA